MNAREKRSYERHAQRQAPRMQALVTSAIKELQVEREATKLKIMLRFPTDDDLDKFNPNHFSEKPTSQTLASYRLKYGELLRVGPAPEVLNEHEILMFRRKAGIL